MFVLLDKSRKVQQCQRDCCYKRYYSFYERPLYDWHTSN